MSNKKYFSIENDKGILIQRGSFKNFTRQQLESQLKDICTWFTQKEYVNEVVYTVHGVK